MNGYVRLGDVHTYYADDGAGEPLVLLHPGGADSRALRGKRPGAGGALPGLPARPARPRPDAGRRGPAHVPADGVGHDRLPAGGRRGPAYLVGHSDGTPVALLPALAATLLDGRHGETYPVPPWEPKAAFGGPTDVYRRPPAPTAPGDPGSLTLPGRRS